MMKAIVSILGLILCIQILSYSSSHAWVIHTSQKRSLDGQPEFEPNEGMETETKLEGRNFARQSQGNSFQFLLPFWWHYLRPMLNIFATNTNFRQTLQKEYEYEIEHGSLNEVETQETEHSSGGSEQAEGSEFEFAGHEVELNENEQAEGGELEFAGHEVELSENGQTLENSFSTGQSNEENGRPDLEHIMESFGSEQESNVQEPVELPELESVTENTHFNDDMGNTEEAANNIGDFGTERESGVENQELENSEEEHRRFFLTGNIVGSFSNSLQDLMPSLWEHEKHNSQFDAFANDEVDINHQSGWEQSAEGTREMNGDAPNSESENFALQTHVNANSLLNNNFHIDDQMIQREDIGDRSPRSFELQNTETGENEITMNEPSERETQLRESFGLVPSAGNFFSSVDFDNSDSVADSIPNQSFITPFSMLAGGLHSQNDQDSGV